MADSSGAPSVASRMFRGVGHRCIGPSSWCSVDILAESRTDFSSKLSREALPVLRDMYAVCFDSRQSNARNLGVRKETEAKESANT